jgi:hypothetical protein
MRFAAVIVEGCEATFHYDHGSSHSASLGIAEVLYDRGSSLNASLGFAVVLYDHSSSLNSFGEIMKILVECERLYIMKNWMMFALCIIITSGLAACSLPAGVNPARDDQSGMMQYETVSFILTETASGGLTKTPIPLAAATTPSPGDVTFTPSTPAAVKEQSRTPVPSFTSSPTFPCDLAQAGRPIDITIPDDTRVSPGQYFSKTWRLINAGSCTWDTDYAAVWFSGFDMGLSRIQSFNSTIAPGRSVDVTVEMVAPMAPGSYQSNWKLRNSQGQYFGIGPNGDAPFWVRIVVVPIDTPTFTPPPPTPTLPPAIFASGTLLLNLEEAVDLDSGLMNQEEANDLLFSMIEEDAFLVPENGARVVHYGIITPSYESCSLAPVSAEPIAMDDLEPGSYLCYRTTRGLAGRIYLPGFDLESGQVRLEFVTWVAQ